MIQINNDQAEGVVPASQRERVPRAAALLGAAGLLPMVGAIGYLLTIRPSFVFGFPMGGIAAGMVEAASILYAVLILNFLGGMWWGQASRGSSSPLIYVAAVVPTFFSLTAVALFARFRESIGAVHLLACGVAVAIVATLLIDKRLTTIGLAPSWWMRLRAPLSLGLAGGLVVIMALAAQVMTARGPEAEPLGPTDMSEFNAA